MPTTGSVLDHLQILLDEHPNKKEATHHVYDLHSIEPSTQHFHAAAGFRPSNMETFYHGHLFASKTSRSISLRMRRHNSSTCQDNDGMCGPSRKCQPRKTNCRKKKHRANRWRKQVKSSYKFTMFRSRAMRNTQRNAKMPFTLTKPESSCMSPAEAIDTKSSSIMLT